MWQGPRLGFVAETGEDLLLWGRLEHDFLACLRLCLASYFSIFVFLFFSCFFHLHRDEITFFVSRRLCSSHLLLSASTYFIFIVRVLSACVICTLPNLGFFFFLIRLAFFFFVALISRVAFLLLCSRTRYAST